MSSRSPRLIAGASIAAVVAISALSLPLTASAAGVGDQSSAVLYEATSPIGTVLTNLTNQDDDSTTIALPFSINFFGSKYDALCVSTNGTVVPVPTALDGCGSDYDVDLAEYATDNDESVIGALLADLDPTEELWPGSIPIASVSVASEIITITTAGPHGYLVGDEASYFLVEDHPELGHGWTDFVDTVISPTQFTINTTGSGIGDFADTALAGSVGRLYDDTIDDSDADGLADDGFGAVKQVYAGATTFEGKPAFAVTWYRMPTNDAVNSPALSNTFQIVFVQEPTTDAVTLGYDFTAQFNFGTLTDSNDGYDAADPTTECDSETPEECRWSVGWARWDSGTDTAEEFELFANAPVSEIVDGGSTPLVLNSLNSAVGGRYTMSMTAGVTGGYAIPALATAVPAGLPVTGSDPAPVLAGGFLLAAVGALLLVARRRRAA
jgi:LPXTG-motif cell wall-anchored protein